jgi:hypothetical protein
MARKVLTTLDLNGPLTIAGSGGTAGYSLTTDGSGNVSWTNVSGGGGGASAATKTTLGTVYGATSISSTTSIGYNAGGTAGNSVAIGVDALKSGSGSSGGNVAVGKFALDQASIGVANTAIGYQAGAGSAGAMSSLSYSVIIGYGAGPTYGVDASSKLYIESYGATDTPLIGGNFVTREVTHNGVSQNAFLPTLTTLYR